MKYEIIEFNELFGQITVSYENGMITAIDLPISANNTFPEGDELEVLIQSYFPQWIIDRQNKLKNILNLNNIRSLVKQKEEVEQEPSASQEEFTPPTQLQSSISTEEQEEMQKEAIREIVLEVLKEQKTKTKK